MNRNRGVKYQTLIQNLIRFLAFSGLFFFCACKKNSETDFRPNVNAATDVVLAESELKFVLDLLLKAEGNTLLWYTGSAEIDSCMVSVDTVKHWIDFQFMDKWCPDSINRNGLVRVEYSGKFFRKGSTAVISLINYKVDIDNNYSGRDSLVNTGQDENHAWVFTCAMPDGEILKTVTGGTTHYSVQGVFMVDSLVSGSFAGRSWYLKGNIDGISSTGTPFSGLISDSLVENISCPWIKTGRITLSVPSAELTEGFIDFVDDSECNPAVLFNFGGNEIYIPRLKHYKPGVLY